MCNRIKKYEVVFVLEVKVEKTTPISEVMTLINMYLRKDIVGSCCRCGMYELKIKRLKSIKGGVKMQKMIHALDIKISSEELYSMTDEERDKFYNDCLDAMTPEQVIQIANIGNRVAEDVVLQRNRPDGLLQDMARRVNVTINESK